MTSRQDLLAEYNRSISRAVRANRDIERAKALLAVDCQHEDTFDTKQDNDNGYGRWWKVDVTHCRLCGKEKTYGTWYKP